MKIKKLLGLLPIILLTACSAKEYPTQSYTLTNNYNETYTIEYTEKSGFPENCVDFVIYHSEKKIADYGAGDYDGVLKAQPQELLYLLNVNDYELYFMGCEYGDYILVNGENDLGFNYDRAEINIESIDYAKETHKEKYFKLAEDLKNSYTESELKEKFVKCGYDYTAIMYLYDLAS